MDLQIKIRFYFASYVKDDKNKIENLIARGCTRI